MHRQHLLFKLSHEEAVQNLVIIKEKVGSTFDHRLAITTMSMQIVITYCTWLCN